MITVSLCLKLATFSPIQRQMSFAATVGDLDLFWFWVFFPFVITCLPLTI